MAYKGLSATKQTPYEKVKEAFPQKVYGVLTYDNDDGTFDFDELLTYDNPEDAHAYAEDYSHALVVELTTTKIGRLKVTKTVEMVDE